MEDEITLQNSFFDSFRFDSTEKEKPKEVSEEEVKNSKLDSKTKLVDSEENTEEKKKNKEEVKEIKEKDEKKIEENKDDSKLDLEKKEVEELVKTLKAKDDKDLKEDEKEFLKDYEENNLDDYKKDSEKKEEENKGYVDLIDNLVSEGILDEVEEVEDTSESLNKAITKTVENKVNGWLEDIPENFRNIIDFMREGGDPNLYMKQQSTIDYKSLDYKNERVQEALIRADLEQQGYSSDDVDEKLKDYKDLEKLEKEAKRSSNILEKQQEKRIKDFNASIEEQVKKSEQKEEEEINLMKETIDKMDDIVGFKLDKKRKKAFKEFLFELDEEGETAASKSSKNIEDRIKLYFMSFINYDFKDLEKKTRTKSVKSIDKLLSRYKDEKTTTTGKSVEDKKQDKEPKLVFPSMFDRNE